MPPRDDQKHRIDMWADGTVEISHVDDAVRIVGEARMLPMYFTKDKKRATDIVVMCCKLKPYNSEYYLPGVDGSVESQKMAFDKFMAMDTLLEVREMKNASTEA